MRSTADIAQRSNTSAARRSPACLGPQQYLQYVPQLHVSAGMYPVLVYSVYVRNTIGILSGTKIGFVTTALHAKYYRYRIGNEHRVCNHWFIAKYCRNHVGNEHMVCNHCFTCAIITPEIALGTNIGFVTTALHAKYRWHRIGNEHKVCNHCFTNEMLQKSYWKRT